ncbi:MAG: glycosyltransferase family 2 protein [Halobacteriaceae archaeon]
MMDDVYVVIAAYNEAEKLPEVIEELHDHDFSRVVIVDDGSADDTFEVVSQMEGVKALRHVINRGQGAALQTGIEYAVEDGADYVVTFDADGQHRAEDAVDMLERVASGDCDVALGSRFLESEDTVPWHRKVLLKGSIIVQWLFYGVSLTDAHNGLRVFNREAAAALDITSDGMEHSSEIAEQVVHGDFVCEEVPVQVRYTEYALEEGHGSYWQAIKVFFDMLKRKLFK